MAKMHVEFAMTVNLGNFESAKYGMSIEEEFNSKEQSREEKYQELNDYVTTKVLEKLDQIVEAKRGESDD